MITGIVNAEFEPIIPLSVRRSDGKIFTQDAIVGTGFNGWLSLPPDLITQLNLKWQRRGRAILGDGSECIFDVYEADSEPLVGMSLMEGYELTMQVFEGGQVELRKVSTI